MSEGETPEEAFERQVSTNTRLGSHHEQLQLILQAQGKTKKIDEARVQPDENKDDDVDDDDCPQIHGEARNAMQDVHDLQDNRQDSVGLQDRISKLNSDQLRIFSKIRDHLVHQYEHETDRCSCDNLKPLHMFFSGVGGTGKSYLIETIRAQVLEIWHANKGDKLKCAVTAPTGLAAFNVGGVTVHRLLQLPIEHESNTAYWPLPKDSRKVLCGTLKYVKLFIVDEVSMVSSLNLAYLHLRMEEIFGGSEWFGSMNVVFVGDLLQLPPVKGSHVFEPINNKMIQSKLGCMTSINIWQETVVYNELMINERQKKDKSYSELLNKIRCGSKSDDVVEALQGRVIDCTASEKFEQLKTEGNFHIAYTKCLRSSEQRNA